MRDFSEKLKSLFAAILRLSRKFLGLCRRGLVWISPPPRLCAAMLGLVFLVSLIAWSAGDRSRDVVLFFPDSRTSALRGELRSVPRSFSAEAKAGIVASEFLLGPMGQRLKPAFPNGIRVESLILRGTALFVDLSEGAALSDSADIEKGVSALEKSLRFSLPRLRRVVVTIGGQEPFKDALYGQSDSPKKAEKN